jgi:hypothetical protein
MSDRSGAYVFGRVFQHLADDPSESNVKFARELWKLRRSGGYDFSDYQMCADKALVTLGLAREVPEAEKDERGEYEYLGSDYTEAT